MPYRKPRKPTLRLKVVNGRRYAVVTLSDPSGKRCDRIMGDYGTDAADAKYNTTIAQWLAAGRVYKVAEQDASRDNLSINELLPKYWEHAQVYYRRKDGTSTNELGDIRLSLKPVREMYGDMDATKFGPLALKAIRERMISQPITTKIKTTNIKDKTVWTEKVIRNGLSRGVINSRIDRIRRAFAWAVSEQLVPVGVCEALKTVGHLQAGRSEARETKRVKPVSEALVLDTLPYLSETVADIVRLLMLTGMRAGEAATMKAKEIDMSGPVWLYKPDHHKVAHLDIDRTIALGPRAQEIIKRYLRPDTQAYLFSPRRAVEESRAKRRTQRKSKVQPSQISRKKRKPKRKPRDHYDTRALSAAIWHACRVHNLEPWHLHQLRHSMGTAARREFGLDHARSALGHRSANITLEYAELDQRKAVEVAARLG